MTKEEIREIVPTIKGGEFIEWYAALTEEEKTLYREVLDELHDKFGGA
jgi:hypothetical protein